MNWNKYVDHIYCLDFLGGRLTSTAKRKGLEDELRRVGILDSGIFTHVYSTVDPWEKPVEKMLSERAVSAEGNRGFINLGLSAARVMREAINLGYRRVMIIENDVRFLKDLTELESVLDHLPCRSVVLLDKFINKWEIPYYRYVEDTKRFGICDGRFYSVRESCDPDPKSGACFIATDFALRVMTDLIENNKDAGCGPRPLDGFFSLFPDLCACVKNAAVQVAYGDGLLFHYMGKDSPNIHHKAYAPQGIRYEDYAVPEGYGYGVRFVDAENGSLVK